MPSVERLLFIKSLTCLFLLASTAGCSNSISHQLLNSRSEPGLGVPVNNLAIPPADVLQTARPDQNPAFIEETELPADVPTLSELSSRPVQGIDAPKVALSLEEDIAAQKTDVAVLWRGKRSLDGVDLANRNGTLCSGTGDGLSGSQTIKVACSDGRIGILKLILDTQRAQIAFKSGSAEAVDLGN